MITSDWKNWYNLTDVVNGTTMSYFSSSVNSVTSNSNLSTCHLLRYLRRQRLRRLAIAVVFAAWKKLFNYCTIVRRISLVYLLVHWCNFSLTLAKVGLYRRRTPPPPVANTRRRQNDVGFGQYFWCLLKSRWLWHGVGRCNVWCAHKLSGGYVIGAIAPTPRTSMVFLSDCCRVQRRAG